MQLFADDLRCVTSVAPCASATRPNGARSPHATVLRFSTVRALVMPRVFVDVFEPVNAAPSSANPACANLTQATLFMDTPCYRDVAIISNVASFCGEDRIWGAMPILCAKIGSLVVSSNVLKPPF